MRLKAMILIFIFLAGGVWYYSISTQAASEIVHVSRIVDGDTVELSNGEKVRLLGINTPEKGFALSELGADLLRDRVMDEDVGLVHFGRDRYGRILGYLFVDGENINALILERGAAHLYYYDHDEYYSELAGAEARAHEGNIGIWEESEFSDCVGLVTLDYYDVGNETEKLVLDNSCGVGVKVVIKDDATHIYNEVLSIGENEFTYQNIFNDGGDSLYVWDLSGKLVEFYRYE